MDTAFVTRAGEGPLRRRVDEQCLHRRVEGPVVEHGNPAVRFKVRIVLDREHAGHRPFELACRGQDADQAQ